MRLILPIAILACLATSAAAEESRNCGTIDEVRTMLTDKYHEAVVAHGVAAEGQVLMTVFASPDGATWSIVMTRAKDGMACITAEGTGYDVRQPEPDQGQGS
jgi:hypothetical protein